MQEHPINNLMEKAMENIKKMVEVNTIVGEAIETRAAASIRRKISLWVKSCPLAEAQAAASRSSLSVFWSCTTIISASKW